MKRFCAVGNHNGLFIIVNPKLKNWFPTNDIAHYSPFTIHAEINQCAYALKYTRNSLEIS